VGAFLRLVEIRAWLFDSLFKKIGMVLAPLHLEVSAVFSSETVFGTLFVTVETLPPERIRRRFVPSILGKLIFPFGGIASIAKIEAEKLSSGELKEQDYFVVFCKMWQKRDYKRDEIDCSCLFLSFIIFSDILHLR
jgi:hypothetical protein